MALIMGALVAGVADTATQAVKDAYAGLRSLVERKFGGEPKAEQALANHAEDPETYEKPLARQLELTGASADAAIVRAANTVVQIAQSEGVQIKYQNVISGGRQAIGDGATFNENPARRH